MCKSQFVEFNMLILKSNFGKKTFIVAFQNELNIYNILIVLSCVVYDDVV